MTRLAPAVRGLALPMTGLLVWAILGLLRDHDASLFVSPVDVAIEGARQFADPALWWALGASLARAAMGLLFGGGLGLVAGVALGLSRSARLTINPILQALKNISLFAWIPLIMSWFGLAETAKVALVAIATFFPMFLNSLEGVRSAPRAWVELGRTFRYSQGQLIRRVVLPAALPSLFTGLQLALVYAWLGTLGAEYMLTSGTGIGNLLNDAREELRIDRLLVYISLIGFVGYILTAAATRLEFALSHGRRAASPAGSAII